MKLNQGMTFAAVCTSLGVALMVFSATSGAESRSDRDITAKAPRVFSVQAKGSTWELGDDELDSDGDPRFTLDHRATSGDISFTLQEQKLENDPPRHNAFWRAYVKGAKKRLAVFVEVPVPPELKMPLGFECHASEEPLIKKDVLEVTHITCTTARSKTHVLLHIWLDKEIEWKKYAADVNDLLAMVTPKQ
ncbi:hypothetical protein [Ottowia thiooxydans]|uniref:hypothetical protein n=1 Tax=Ottowia thiooxydans TaxID=219182 RepID=UPI0003F4CCDA|nr:hypothetical protein [Ottowia thiooxydans]